MSHNKVHLFCINIAVSKGPRIDLLRLIRIIVFTIAITLVILSLGSCKKLVKIDEPVSSITTSGAFSSEATATSAVTAIYSKMANSDGTLLFGSGATSLFVGLSSDELTKVSISDDLLQYNDNELLPENGTFPNQMWGSAYFTIYQANSSIEGLEKSSTLNATFKNQLMAECKFLRAYTYFYLTNLWGDIPMPLTGNWSKTHLISRTPKADVYTQVINDLVEAKDLLPENYAVSNNERIRANKFAATALLARVYLYQKQWANAESHSSIVISNSGLYKLPTNLSDVFKRNSTEAILQLQPNENAYPWAVLEGSVIQEFPIYYITDTLANSFEVGDQRKTKWLKPDFVSGMPVYVPFKYTVDYGNPGDKPLQYYMVLRLAEQYLIRAEARAQQNKITEALDDLNTVRNRAGLSDTTLNDQSSLLLAMEHERQTELFAEWGHRWFDLIRTNRATAVLGGLKGSRWQPTDQLYPIPKSEIQKNPNLSQNTGYR